MGNQSRDLFVKLTGNSRSRAGTVGQRLFQALYYYCIFLTNIAWFNNWTLCVYMHETIVILDHLLQEIIIEDEILSH